MTPFPSASAPGFLLLRYQGIFLIIVFCWYLKREVCYSTRDPYGWKSRFWGAFCCFMHVFCKVYVLTVRTWKKTCQKYWKKTSLFIPRVSLFHCCLMLSKPPKPTTSDQQRRNDPTQPTTDWAHGGLKNHESCAMRNGRIIDGLIFSPKR